MTSKGSTLETIHDIIKCSICLNSPKNPRFCPCCSALFCMECINKWIVTNPSCPACRNRLDFDNLSSNLIVSNILNELSKSQEYVQPDLCSIHHYDMIYYCNRCFESICSDCALFQHKDHNIEKISVIYNKCLEIIKVEEEALKKRQEELMELSIFLDSDYNQLDQNKKEIEDDIAKAVEDFKTRLEDDVDQRFSVISNSQQKLNTELTHLDDLYDRLVQHYKKSPSEFIKTSAQITKNLQEVHKNSILEIYKPINTDLQSELTPQYEIRLMKFKDFLNSTQPFINRISYFGTTWELKCGVDDDNIYLNLKLLETPLSAKYFYKFSIINQRSNMNKEYESSFPLDAGNSLFIPNFSTKDQLIDEGYVLPESDILLLQFSFKPKNYYHLTNDLKFYITMLETQNSILRNTNESLNSSNNSIGNSINNNINNSSSSSNNNNKLTSSFDYDKSPRMVSEEEYFGDDELDDEGNSTAMVQQHIKRRKNPISTSLYLNMKYNEDDEDDDEDEYEDDNYGEEDDEGDTEGEEDDEGETSDSSLDENVISLSSNSDSSLSLIDEQEISGTDNEINHLGQSFKYNFKSGGTSGKINNIPHVHINNIPNNSNNNNIKNSQDNNRSSQWDLQTQFNSLNIDEKWKTLNHKDNNNNNNYFTEFEDSFRIDQSHENTENEMGYDEMEPIPDIQPPTLTSNNTSSQQRQLQISRIHPLALSSTHELQRDIEDDEEDEDDVLVDDSDVNMIRHMDHYNPHFNENEDDGDDENDDNDDDEDDDDENIVYSEDQEQFLSADDDLLDHHHQHHLSDHYRYVIDDYDDDPFDSDLDYQPTEEEEIYIDGTADNNNIINNINNNNNSNNNNNKENENEDNIPAPIIVNNINSSNIF